MEHWSERFDRNFKDDDWLDRHEAAQVLSANSGRMIYPEYLSSLVQRGVLHPRKVGGRLLRYQYSELRTRVVRRESEGRPQTDSPSPAAVRMRAYRARR